MAGSAPKGRRQGTTGVITGPKRHKGLVNLAVILGNGTQDETCESIKVDIMLKNQRFPANLQLLDLPSGFDCLVGLDWLSKHNCKPQVAAGPYHHPRW